MTGSLLVLVVAACLAVVNVVSGATVIGGSSAAAPLVNQLVLKQNYIPKSYASSKSQAGINGLKSGLYEIGVATIPFAPKEEVNFKKLTIPQAIITVSLFQGFTSKAIHLTGAQIAKIYLGKITNWNQIAGSGLKGVIKPVVRSDAAGVTQIVTTYLYKSSGGVWPLRFVGEGPFTYGNKNTIYEKGAAAVANTIKKTALSFGWAQTGTGRYQFGLKEISIRNRAGNFVQLTARPVADYQAAIPRQPPPASASWAGVSLVYVQGVSTFPVVSFVYFFYRTSYKKAAGTAVKKFGLYTQTAAAQNIAASYFFYRVPTKLTTQGTAAIKTIKLT